MACEFSLEWLLVMWSWLCGLGTDHRPWRFYSNRLVGRCGDLERIRPLYVAFRRAYKKSGGPDLSGSIDKIGQSLFFSPQILMIELLTLFEV